MKIAHVVTLVSPDGAFGGPLRVAVNQCKALQEAGDDTVIFAGVRGYDSAPTNLEGIELRSAPARYLIPGAGFAGMIAPGLYRQLRSSLDEFDVVHIHVARDLITLPAARVALKGGKRYILQPHGMVDPSERLLARPLDALLTRPVFNEAAAVLHLNEKDRQGVAEAIGPDLPFVHLRNGVPDQPKVNPAERTDPLEVLFLARLHERKRPTAFVEMAVILAEEFPQVIFTLVGPDEGEASAVMRAIAASNFSDRIRWTGALPLNETVARMRKASIYVLPSVDEPFPMSVLEAMSVGLAVIVTDTNGLAEEIDRTRIGLVTDGSPTELASAVRSVIENSDERRVFSEHAFEAITNSFSMKSIVHRLRNVYGDR